MATTHVGHYCVGRCCVFPDAPLTSTIPLPYPPSSDSLVGLAAAATSIASVMVHAHSSVELASMGMLHKV